MAPQIKTNPNSTFTGLFFSIFLLVLLTWLSFFSPVQLNANILTFFEISTLGFLSFFFAHAITGKSPKSKTGYRLAFFISVFISLVFTLISSYFYGQGSRWGVFILAMVASFVGNFVASNVQRGWVENNAPPSQQIEAEVLNWHRPVMRLTIHPMPGKRLFDILFAAIFLLVSAPIWLLIIILIWWEDPGPVLFIKNAVGKGGMNFKQYKFRSMILDAEKDTGPISGYENDERVLFFGKIIRKTALDELPQLVNILLGDMSCVGPRPQRTVLVHQYLQNLPEYAQRHRIKPGLAGLAQVADSYDISPEVKLAWDLVYIEKASLWLDIKLLASAFYLVFALRWLPNSNPESKIRSLLKVQKPQL